MTKTVSKLKHNGVVDEADTFQQWCGWGANSSSDRGDEGRHGTIILDTISQVCIRHCARYLI
jgi:hypothetical protein